MLLWSPEAGLSVGWMVVCPMEKGQILDVRLVGANEGRGKQAGLDLPYPDMHTGFNPSSLVPQVTAGQTD